MRSRLVFVVLVGALAACSSKTAADATATDAASADTGAIADGAAGQCVHPTPPKSACQEHWCVNPYGVGMPCTKGGGECDLNAPKDDGVSMGAVMCTAVYGDGSDAFCTKPCGDDSDCGKGARCSGDPSNPGSGRGCILVACSPYPDAVSGGSDATSTVDVSKDVTAGFDSKD